MNLDKLTLTRKTKETDIKAGILLYGNGKNNIQTGIGFFDHMLEAFSKHSLINLDIKCDGDLEVDFHHSVEDVGIVIGKLLYEAMYPIHSIERFGDSIVVMDEAAVSCAIDISNRPFFVYENFDINSKIKDFDFELIEEFFKAISFNAGITLHLNKIRGKNLHHIAEASFKAFAVALRRALSQNKKIATPSTKGII